jgi:hypothetical protein
MATETTIPSARIFVRSLNVLLKYARLYGMAHSRSAGQFDAAWSELETAISGAGEGGLLLGTSGSQLLLDGVPLESSPAERTFAQLLTAAGVASICFTRKTTRDDFTAFVRAFALTGTKSANLAEQLKMALGPSGESVIRVNEIRFVAEDAAYGDARMAATLTARTLGADADKMQSWLKDPQKLIQLIAAAEGADHGAPAGAAGSEAGPAAAAGSGSAATGGTQGKVAAGPMEEEDVLGILRLLSQLGEAGRDRSATVNRAAWQQKMVGMSKPAQATLREALASVAAATPSSRLDEPVLVRLAEDLAIRFALDRFQRGEVRVNAVRQLLERMGREVEGLRKLLTDREDRMTRAGLNVESYADTLDRQFWASVPESGKRRVLLSPEAWCIPPRNVQQFVEELLGPKDPETAEAILLQYAGCIRHKDVEARRKAAIGIGQIAELYGRAGGRCLTAALRELAAQIGEEREADVLTLLNAAFVRLSQEAASRRHFPAVQQALDSLEHLERTQPGAIQGVRPRIGVENRLPEFIEESLGSDQVSGELIEVLRRLPHIAAEHLAARMPRTTRRSERERLIEVTQKLGEPALDHLRLMLREHPIPKAASTIGLLSRLDFKVLENLLPGRMREGQRALHDTVLRQLAAGGATGRGRLLLEMLELLDPLVVPGALVEVGMSGDAAAVPRLLCMAEGEVLPLGGPFLRLKAIEALGRLGTTEAADPLRKILEAKHMFRWAHPRELRLAAAQALEQIDPEWIASYIPRSGLDADEFAFEPLTPSPDEEFVRIRRYRRLRTDRDLAVVITTARARLSGALKVLSLEGGLLAGDMQLAAGTEASLRITAGMRSANMQVLVRYVRSQQAGFEVVGTDLEDRSKLRRLLLMLSGPSSPTEQPLACAT